MSSARSLTRGRLLGGVPMLAALAFAGLALATAPGIRIGPPALVAALAAVALLWVVVRRDDRRDDTLPALAVLISALGLITVARLSPALAQKQVVWLAFSLGLAVVAGPAFDRFRALAAYKYLWILATIGLFLALLVAGQEVNGAKLWIRVGGAQFEPVELIKLLVVLFMAAYLAETADVIARTKPWSLRANAKYLGPLFVGWGVSMGILVLQRDIGMAALLLATFVAILYVATRRIDLVVGATAVFALAASWAMTHYKYVETRVAVWHNPQADPLGSGYQPLQALFSLGAGGLFGTGLGRGRPDYIPDAATDYIFAAFTEEFGALGAIVLVGAFLAITLRALRIAQRSPDLYGKLLATGLAATFGFQVVIIVGGVLRLWPLTGITLPFFSYGGSSLVANFLLVAMVWAISAERPIPTR